MKYKLILIILLLFALQACSQKKEETMNITQNPEITAANIVEKLTEDVKQYPQEPIYLIDFGRDLCFVEILINDIPVYKAFNRPTSSTATEINQAIFKNGTQKVTYRLYPAGKLESEDQSQNNFSKFVAAYFNPEVYDKKIGGHSTTLKEYKIPTIPNPKEGEYPDSIFIATGKDYYEGTFTFEAEVPYQLQNFNKAQDLRKIDKKTLEAKLLKKYEEMKNIYQSKNMDNIARISYDKLKNEQIAYYYNGTDAKEMWDTLVGVFSGTSFQMQPIENYEMQFFAEGKLVALMTKSKEFWLRGNTALWAKSGSKVLTFNDYFYLPEGETEFRVY